MTTNPSQTPDRVVPDAKNFFAIPVDSGACRSYFIAWHWIINIYCAVFPLFILIMIWSTSKLSFLWLFLILLVLGYACLCFIYWLAGKQSAALNYRIEKRTLRADWGVFFLKRKAIPLDRITDFALVQGPLMRMFGVWAMRVQTAGTGSMEPEATLYAIIDPEQVRDELIRRRDEAAVDSNYPG